MSITNRLRLAIAALAAILIGGVILTILLALGLADPPRAGSLQWQADSPEAWPQASIMPDLQVLQAPHDLPQTFTLELTARNDGSPDSAWGLQLWLEESPITILLDNQGYISIGTFSPVWEVFVHSHANEPNTLYFHVTQNGQATIRINDEIVRDNISLQVPINQWSIVTYRQAQLAWSRIALYHQ